MKVFGRVFVRRRVAAADVAADEAHPQMNPAPTDFEAILTSLRARRHILNLIDMGTLTAHDALLSHY
jgi:hypothetical protein